MIKNYLIQLIDFFYFLFKRFMPLRTYRYAVCGGSNLVSDTILYFLCFHFLLQKQNLDLEIVVLSAHIASLFMVFPITFCIGFLLNRYIVFAESELAVGTQLVRYFAAGILSLFLSYCCMKVFVDVLGFFPTPSRLATVIITVLFSYIMQSRFTFKIEQNRSLN